MDKLEQENIDELIKRQTGDGASDKLKISVEEDDTTLDSLQVIFFSILVLLSFFRFSTSIFFW